MKWTVLSDNRTNNDLLQTEHGLSILLETEKHRFLLDTGASDVFIRNATHLGIDLSTVDYVCQFIQLSEVSTYSTAKSREKNLRFWLRG